MRSSSNREVVIALELGVECKEIRKASGQGQDPDRTQGYRDAPGEPRLSGFQKTDLTITGKWTNTSRYRV